ncbi:hypothetical protein NDU88_007117 [Pleurodeles waltl]|uniref:Uncharacterized protein n=1 Tax=Pleurodeles waltl TaxID=8319 RepID=A0AAV7PKD0_PLEWA|nr:hypothetical protein NDU88_007117 [Pleurodeles waltl]
MAAAWPGFLLAYSRAVRGPECPEEPLGGRDHHGWPGSGVRRGPWPICPVGRISPPETVRMRSALRGGGPVWPSRLRRPVVGGSLRQWPGLVEVAPDVE